VIKLLDLYLPDGVRGNASEFLYELMRERETETNISHKEMPSYIEHQAYLANRPYRFWYDEGHWVGYVSATHKNEIGVVIQKSHRRKGYGMAAIKMLMDMHQPIKEGKGLINGHWLANVNPVNAPSRALFEELGGRLIQVTYQL